VDTSNTSNKAEVVVVSHRTGAGTYLSTGDMKHAVDKTAGIGSHADMLTGHEDTHTVKMDVLKPINAPNIVSIPQMKPKLPDLHGDGARLALNGPNGWGSHMDMLSAHMNVQSVRNTC